MIWAYPKRGSVYLTKLIHSRILPVTWVTLACPRRNCYQWEHLLGRRWVLRGSPRPACSTCLRASWGRVYREGRNPVFQLPHHSPSLSKLGLLLPGHSLNLPDPNFLPLPHPLCLLGLSPPTQST